MTTDRSGPVALRRRTRDESRDERGPSRTALRALSRVKGAHIQSDGSIGKSSTEGAGLAMTPAVLLHPGPFLGERHHALLNPTTTVA